MPAVCKDESWRRYIVISRGDVYNVEKEAGLVLLELGENPFGDCAAPPIGDMLLAVNAVMVFERIKGRFLSRLPAIIAHSYLYFFWPSVKRSKAGLNRIRPNP
jgi:hypothetical protein